MHKTLLGLLCGLMFALAYGCASHSTQDHAHTKSKKSGSSSTNVEVYGVIDAGVGHTRIR